MRLSYKCKSAKERIELLDIMLKLGYLWHSEHKWKSGYQIDKEYSYKHYPVISFYDNTKHIAGNFYTYGKELTEEEVYVKFGITSPRTNEQILIHRKVNNERN